MSGRISPVWVAPVEVARAMAPPQVRMRLIGLEALGVRFRQSAFLMAVGGRVVACVEFVDPCPDGKTALQFQTGVALRENG